jgi:hypothetical protein
VEIALLTLAVDDCASFDRDGLGSVSIDEIVFAVLNSTNNCLPVLTATPGGAATATRTATRTNNSVPTPTATARPTTPATPNFVVRGKILQASSGGGGVFPADGAQAEATNDRDGNGQIGSGESRQVTSDGEGSYVLNLAVAEGDQIVLGFQSGDSAPLFRTLEASPGGDVTVNVTLRTADALGCEGARCALQGDRLTIEGLPPGTMGMAQLFNPVTQTDAFPGTFSDSDGNLLLSGVFASIELVNAVGQPLEQLPAPATLRMQIPRETWPIVSDINPGNGRIDVPLYAYDEVAGAWVRDGAAVLEDDQRAVIGEGSLASIRNGSFTGNVIARGEVQHFSYWNIDWPIAAHACISGRLLDDQGQPASGAAVTIRGLTYVGSSTTTTDADGRFCADVLRSENPGEDVDQDGVTGETQRVTIRVSHAGKVYDAGATDVPVQAATCSVGCADFGEVSLTPDKELQATVCSLTVRVRDRAGDPVAGAFVVAADQTIDPEISEGLCMDMPLGFCVSSGVTDESGEASLSAVLLDSLFVAALSMTQEGESTLNRWGEATLSNGCPVDPVLVTLTEGFRLVNLIAEFTPPGTISWSPTTPANTVAVTGSLGAKWLVAAPAPGFQPPVIYGTIPAGAIQLLPSGGGAPPALASGDFIAVGLTAPGTDGYPIIGQGFTIVP